MTSYGTLAAAAQASAEQLSDWRPTSEPLVETGPQGLRPAGHPFSAEPQPNGLNCYGLTDVEMVAYQRAVARLQGIPEVGATYLTMAESIAIRDAQLGPHTDSVGIIVPGASTAAKIAYVEKLRETTPLPTSYYSPPVYDPQSIIQKEAANQPIPAGVIQPLDAASINRQPPPGSISTGGANEAPGASPTGETPATWNGEKIAIGAALVVAGLFAFGAFRKRR